MPVPSVLSNRLSQAITAVDANTDLDTLVSYIDVCQRGGVAFAAAAAEITRRANLVDSNTSYVTAAKLTAALFKIDNPAPQLWAGAAGGSAGGAVIGQYVSGWLSGNPNFVPASGARYLVSAYPDMTQLLTDRSMDSFYEPVSFQERIATGRADNSGNRDYRTFVDGDVIIAPQMVVSIYGYVFNISTDGGQTWRGSLPRSYVSPALTPEAQGFNASPWTLHVSDVVKLDAPGHYGACIMAGVNGGNLGYIFTTDYGVNWNGWSIIETSATFGSPYAIRLFYRNGVLLSISSAHAKYSINGGNTWLTLNSNEFRQTGAIFHGELSSDGFLTWANDEAIVRSFSWPAAPANWNANVVPTSQSLLLVACSRVKKCGAYYIAWSGSSNFICYLNSSNPIGGTYTRVNFAGVNVVYDVQEHGGNLYILGMGNNGLEVFTIPATLPFSTTPTALTTTDTPWMINATTENRVPIRGTKFAVQLAASSGVFFGYGRTALAKYVAPTGTNRFSHVAYDQPQNYMPAFCRKYDAWFCSIPHTTDSLVSASASYYRSMAAAPNMERCGHYRSTDGRNWIPIGGGWSGIVDAGTHLVRLDGLGRIQRSTDGLTWSNSGVTQPTIGTITFARLWRVKDLLFYLTSPSTTNSSSAVLNVSSNAGQTWTSVGSVGGSMMLGLGYCKASITHYRGAYYAFTNRVSSNPQSVSPSGYDILEIWRSVDGLTWTSVNQITINPTTFQYDRVGFIHIGERLHLMGGGNTNNTNQAPMVTTNGFNWTFNATDGTTQLLQSADAIEMDCSNGELRAWYDLNWTIQASTFRGVRSFKAGVADINFVGATSVRPIAIGGNGADLMAVTANGISRYGAASLAFVAATPLGSNTIPNPFLKVTK